MRMGIDQQPHTETKAQIHTETKTGTDTQPAVHTQAQACTPGHRQRQINAQRFAVDRCKVRTHLGPLDFRAWGHGNLVPVAPGRTLRNVLLSQSPPPWAQGQLPPLALGLWLRPWQPHPQQSPAISYLTSPLDIMPGPPPPLPRLTASPYPPLSGVPFLFVSVTSPSRHAQCPSSTCA